jgi:hypothetical protein
MRFCLVSSTFAAEAAIAFPGPRRKASPCEHHVQEAWPVRTADYCPSISVVPLTPVTQ